MRENFFGRALFDQLAVRHEKYAVGDLAGKAHLVRDDDHRHARVCQLLHDLQHLADHLRVERARRLVEEHDLGLHCQRADDGNTLLLPAGELAGIGVRAVGKPDTGQKLQRGLFCVLFRFMQQLHRRDGHVFENRHVREEIKMLEHHAHLLAVEVDVAVFVGDVRAVKENLPAGGKLEQVQTPQECRLAAAGRTDHDHNLAPVNLRGYTVERADFIVLTLLRAFEVLLQLGYLNQNVSGHCCAASSLISRPAR